MVISAGLMAKSPAAVSDPARPARSNNVHRAARRAARAAAPETGQRVPDGSAPCGISRVTRPVLMPLVEIRGVSKIYHLGGEEIRALDDVSLDIEAGEFISIIGP